MSGIPGSPWQVQATAENWRAASEALVQGAHTMRKAEPHSWEGAAAIAFRDAQATLDDHLATASERLANASTLLNSYSAVLAQLATRSADLHDDREGAKARLSRNPLDAVAALDVLRFGLEESAQLRRAQDAANDTARRLLALVGFEDCGNQNWWDPLGWWDDESKPDGSVNEGTLDDTKWDPAYVAQGSIGDCYAISTIMGYMRTPAGQETLKENIRWDDSKDGYWVTLYVNGEPKEFFVDKVYDQGVDQVDGHTLWWTNTSHNVVNLYEAALAQATNYDDIDDGGTANSVMEAITGRPSQMVEFGGNGVHDNLPSMSAALDSGSPVVASSVHGQGKIPIDDVTVTRPDGTTKVTDIDIVMSHAYEVERIDDDGSVWIRNPWGPDNSADGGGLIKLSSAQFDSAFWRAAYEETS